MTSVSWRASQRVILFTSCSLGLHVFSPSSTQDDVGPLKLQEIDLVNVNWKIGCETSHFIPLFALDVSFCSAFRLNCFKYFQKCRLSFPLSHYEVSLTKMFHTHKYEMDWFLLKFQNHYFKSIRKLLSFVSVEGGIFWKLQFFLILFHMEKNGNKALLLWADVFQNASVNSLKAVFCERSILLGLFFFFFFFAIPWLEPNQDIWLDWPQH